MIALLQRVRRASVAVEGRQVAAIERGLLAFLGVCRGDDEAAAVQLARRVLALRCFADGRARMNRSLADVGGALLVVSQFTLCAELSGGNRPSFSDAAAPAEARRLYDCFIASCGGGDVAVASGEFGADMQVSLVNDGPVTFWMEH